MKLFKKRRGQYAIIASERCPEGWPKKGWPKKGWPRKGCPEKHVPKM